MRIKAPIPSLLLGTPIPGSENPYLAAPAWELEALIDLSSECLVDGISDTFLSDAVREFSYRLFRGLELDDECIRLRLHSKLPPYRLGVYASLTSVIVYGAARLYGEKLSTLEVLELARLAEVLEGDSSFHAALEALRYATLEGSVAVYRNEEEHSKLPSKAVRVNVLRIKDAQARVSKDSVGSDVYGAIIHLMGVTVLEAAIRLREGMELKDTILSLKPVHDAVTLAVWGLAPSKENCLWTLDLPGSFAEACIE